jgi:hypothetical protein
MPQVIDGLGDHAPGHQRLPQTDLVGDQEARHPFILRIRVETSEDVLNRVPLEVLQSGKNLIYIGSHGIGLGH